MSEELNLLREALRRVKHEAASLADAQVIALEALTQRPAAQTEREAPYGYCPECGAPGVTRERRPDGDDKCSNGHRYPSRSAHASLPTQPAAQDEREADEVFLPRRLAATQKLTQLGYRYDSAHGKWLPAPQKATPEPVGEVVAWQRRDRNIVTGEWSEWREDDDIEEELDPEWAERRPLFTRPAPGVPDDATLEGIATAACKHIDDDWFSAATVCALNALHTLRDEIAAAQAKGGQ